MRIRHGRIALGAMVVSMLAVGESAAQNHPEIIALPPEVTGYLRTGGIFYENFFQLPDGGPRQDVLAGILEMRIEERLGADAAFGVYTRADFYQFDQLGSSPGGVIGVRRLRGANQFDVSVTAQLRRPRFNSGDELEQANVLAASGSYTRRVVPALDLVAMAEYSREQLKVNSERRRSTYQLGGAVRGHAFGRRLSAEGGLLQGAHEVIGRTTQYVDGTRYVAVRLNAVRWMYVSVRYRNREREYATPDVASSDYGREDRRQQVTAYLDVALPGNLVWNVSGGIEQADSTRPGRSFRSRQFGTALSLVLSAR